MLKFIRFLGIIDFFGVIFVGIRKIFKKYVHIYSDYSSEKWHFFNALSPIELIFIF